MLDRYLVSGGRALDLATGAGIRWHLRRGATPATPLFTQRAHSWLIDFDLRGRSRVEVWERPTEDWGAESNPAGTVDAFRAALADARDGRPRALDLVEPSLASWALTHRLLAREARLAGFVPLAADALGAVLGQHRWRWPSWLKERSIVVFATDARLSPDAVLALFRLATKDARPHLVVRTATGDRAWRPRLVSVACQVHEGAAEMVAGPEELIARARDQHANGRVIEAEATARWGVLLTVPGPEHTAARCALARCLIAQRRFLEARAALINADSDEAADLRSQILVGPTDARNEPAMVETFLDILHACQDVDDGELTLTLTRTAELLRERLAASTIAFITRHHDQPHAVAHAGAAAPPVNQLEMALRVLDTGLPVGPVDRGPAVEAAWPVRYGATVVGALWCHWAVGAPLVAPDIAVVLRLAASASAPAAYEVFERTRIPSVTMLMPELVGDSQAMQLVRQVVLRAAGSPFPVLIEGESGVGKELVARAVHAASLRRARRFCALNCAAINDDLVEAELFGHARGAFTGAVAERLGLFEDAQGGTLFLDEVAELGARVQAKLLRTLQEGEVRRLGESHTRKVDARIVAATNRPLEAAVAADRFRADLRYRLDVLRITIPPLRERLEDIPPLARHLWSVLAARTGSRAVLSPSALTALGAYDWPGNVRELQNVLASAMVAGPPKGVIGAGGLAGHLTRATAIAGRATLADARRAFEMHFVRAALARAGGRPTVAARELGVSRQGLTKLLARLGLPGLERPSAPAH